MILTFDLDLGRR